MTNSNEYMNRYMKDRYKRRREEAVEYLGGKCARCGNNEKLEIDHINFEDKSFNLSKALSGWSWARILPELEKCQVLCKECHQQKTKKDLAKKFNQRESWEHGTLSGYRYCRCENCKKAKKDYMREYRIRKSAGV